MCAGLLQIIVPLGREGGEVRDFGVRKSSFAKTQGTSASELIGFVLVFSLYTLRFTADGTDSCRPTAGMSSETENF